MSGGASLARFPAPAAVAAAKPRPPVLDANALVYDRHGWRTFFQLLAAVAPHYLAAFAAGLAHAFRVEPAAYLSTLRTRGPAAAIDLLVAGQPESLDVDAHLRELDRQGIAGQIVHGLPGGGVNDRVAALAAAARGRIHAWASVSLLDPDAAVAEIGRCRGLGMSGVSVAPFYDGIPAADERCDAVLAAAERLGLPVWIHTGQHFRRDRPIDLCTWRDIDRIAVAHPGLVLVAGHGGWPWVAQMVAVAQRHPGVHIDISSHRPSRMALPGSGWEPLLLHGRGVIRDKVLFGTASVLHPIPASGLADEVLDLGLGERAARGWLGGNAARVLGARIAAAPDHARPDHPASGG